MIYDTMWHSTERMAEAIHDGIMAEGVVSMPMNLRAHHRSEIMTEVFDARAVVVGSPTLNNGLFPTVADFLCYMRGLKPRNKIGAAFGSYGWSGEAVKLIENELREMKIDPVEPGLRVQFVPEAPMIEACREFGRKIGRQWLFTESEIRDLAAIPNRHMLELNQTYNPFKEEIFKDPLVVRKSVYVNFPFGSCHKTQGLYRCSNPKSTLRSGCRRSGRQHARRCGTLGGR